MKSTDRLSLTRAAQRRRIASLISDELAKVDGAEVVTTEEGADGFGERRRTIRATAAGVCVMIDCDGALPDFIMAHWYMTDRGTDRRRFAPRFAGMIGGTVNNCHWQKATGPMISRDRIGFRGEQEAFEVRVVVQFAQIVRRALQDIVEGGCFQAPEPDAQHPPAMAALISEVAGILEDTDPATLDQWEREASA